MANKYYKYRLKPNKKQQELIIKTFGCCRFIYNKMLEDKINYYKETKQMLNNTPAQYKSANEQMNLQAAYRNFFRNPKIGFPKFKSKKKDKKTYTTNNVFIPEKHFVKLPKLGKVRFVEHRQIPKGYIIKSATISLAPSGKFYISILTEYEEKVPKTILDKYKAIGLDYSSPNFYIDNKGNKAGYERYYRTLENYLAKEQRILSHMVYGSNNYKKQKNKDC